MLFGGNLVYTGQLDLVSSKGVLMLRLVDCPVSLRVGGIMSGTVGITRERQHHLLALSMLAGLLLAVHPCALGLDPTLDITQYAHTAWRIREGFTKGTISSIAQTPDGYLWLGTEFGLLRFDGVRNVAWQPPANQHLPSEDILSLLAARDGTLWIGTSKGLASWKGGKLVQYPELAGMIIPRLLEDHEDTVWASGVSIPTPGRLCAIHDGSVHCSSADGSLGPGVFGLFEDRSNNLWVGVVNGLWRWKPGTPEFYSLPDHPNGIQALAEGDDGALLIATRVGLQRFVGGKFEPLPVPSAAQQFKPITMLRDRDGGLWIGTWQGLLHVHRGKAELLTQADGLSGNYVAALVEDREGNVWAATLNGLDRFREFAVTTLSKNQGLSNASVRSVLADRDGSVWLGAVGALNRWYQGLISIYGKNGKLDGLDPNSLYQDSHGRIWFSTAHGFGYLEHGRFVQVSGVPAGDMPSIAEDSARNLWIANKDQGLIRVSPRSEVQQIPWAGLGHKDNGLALAADPSRGGLWVGFFEGGIVYLADGSLQASYSPATGSREGPVNDLRVDQEGTLWASTEGGLSRLKNGRLMVLNSKNGLPCDAVHWMIEDNDHSFWLNMPCGLVRIVRSELDAWVSAADKDQNAKPVVQATVFDSADGVRVMSYAIAYTPHVAKSTDGKLWFSGLDGVNVVDPHHIPFNNIPPPVHIEKITANDKSYPLSNGVHLPAQIRNLDIDYAALSLVVPEKVRFRVKLEGQDKDWRELVNVRHVEYTNLPPKQYRFRVLACNNSGVWNEEGATLEFVIPPAWYQTNWFLAACVAAFLAMVWGIHELRVWRLAYQFNMRMEERVSERTRIARDLHDTLLQSFQGLMLHFQTGIDMLPGRPAEARKTLEIAIDRADQAIAEGRDAVQGLRASTVETNDLACAVRILGEELRAEGTDQNSALFEMEVEGTPRNLHPILRDEVYRITGEALRNAFRHARAQRIEVEILYGERWLRLRVRDDGKGIDPKLLSGEGLAGHYGLHGMRERAKVVGGKLAVWSKLDSGTEVELSIPASTAYAKPARHRSWLSEKLSGKGTDFKETDVKETKTKS